MYELLKYFKQVQLSLATRVYIFLCAESHVDVIIPGYDGNGYEMEINQAYMK